MRMNDVGKWDIKIPQKTENTKKKIFIIALVIKGVGRLFIILMYTFDKIKIISPSLRQQNWTWYRVNLIKMFYDDFFLYFFLFYFCCFKLFFIFLSRELFFFLF